MRHIEELNLTIYSEESYKKCFPDAKQGDYEKYIDIPFSEMIKKMEQTNNVKIHNIRCVPIDDLYFDFIKENNLENTSQMRVDFMGSLDDNNAKYLWENSEHGEVLNISTLAVQVLSKPGQMLGNIKIDKTNLIKIKNILKEYYNVSDEDIICFDTLYRADYLYAIQEQVEENIIRGLCGEKLVNYNNSQLDKNLKKELQKQTSCTLLTRMLVFGVLEKTRYKLTRTQALNDDIGIKDGILSNKVTKKLNKLFSQNILKNTGVETLQVIPVVERLYRLEEFTEMINNSLLDALEN